MPYIFGAHSRAKTTAYYLEYNKNIAVDAYLYDDDDNNPTEIDGVPVIDIRLEPILDTTMEVYLGIRGSGFRHATEILLKIGFKTIIPVDVEFDNRLRNEYYHKLSCKGQNRYIKLESLGSAGVGDLTDRFKIYIACSAYDSQTVRSNDKRDEEEFLQVGTDVSGPIDIAEVFDNDFEGNISLMNRQFCELTGLFWIWKKSDYDYVGLEHYRRRFVLPTNWKSIIVDNKIDIVLPTPMCLLPNVAEDFSTRHSEAIWHELLSIIRKRNIELIADAESHWNEKYFTPCNMFIMKKTVLNEYCQWAFPILFDLNKSVGALEDKYLNRYPGFVGERLLSFWCYYYRNKYSIAYCDKIFCY